MRGGEKWLKLLKPHHHARLDYEFKFNCETWKVFLTNFRNNAVCRPMVDLTVTVTVHQLNFSLDASANKALGFGAVFDNKWLFGQWEPHYIERCSPSIEYLELFALVAAILTWGGHICNTRIVIFCDNSAVMGMVNNLTSSCKNCMYLIRLLTLNNLVFSRRIFVKHITSENNYLSDALSRLKFQRFQRLAHKGMNAHAMPISELVWLASKIWQKFAD